MNRRHLYVPLAVLLAGCPLDSNGDGTADPGEVTDVGHAEQEAPAAPTFVVSGTVIDGATRLPVGNQRVSLNYGENTPVIASALTDAAGAFTIAGAGDQMFLRIAVDGYQTASVRLYDLMNYTNNGGLYSNFPTDNGVLNLDQLYLAPATSSMSFTIVRRDGVPVANVPVQISLPTLGAFGEAFGFDRRAVTTDANGVATVDRVPNVALAQTLVESNFFAAILVPPVDVNEDGVYDYSGTWVNVDYQRIGEWGGKVVGAVLAPVQNDLRIVAGNAIMKGNDTRIPAVATSTPLVFVFNQPVDPLSLSISVRSDFPHRLANGKVQFDDSTPEFSDESFPEPPFAGAANDGGGAANEMTVTLDASKSIATATPKRAFAAGRQYVVTIAAASALAANQTPRRLRQSDVFMTQSGVPVALESVYLERSGNSNTYANAVIELNQPIRGVFEPYSGKVSRLYACIDADLNGDGDRVGPGGAVLDKGECPGAGYVMTSKDLLESLLVLGLRVSTEEAVSFAPGFGRFFDLNLNQPHMADATSAAIHLDTGATSVPLKIYINPIVSGSTLVGNSSAAIDSNLAALPTQILDATLDTTNTATRLSRPPVGGSAVLVRAPSLPSTTVSLSHGESICNDGIDNDVDGTFDCDAMSPDSDCVAFCDAPAVVCNPGETALVHTLAEDVTQAGFNGSWVETRNLPVKPGTNIGQLRIRFDMTHPTNSFGSYIYTPNYSGFMYVNWFQSGPNFTNTRLSDGAATVLGAAAAPHTGSFRPIFGYSFAGYMQNRDAFGNWPYFLWNYASPDPVHLNVIDLFICVKL